MSFPDVFRLPIVNAARSILGGAVSKRQSIAEVWSRSGAGLGWSLMSDKEPLPKLNAYAIAAAIGYSHLSRWMTLKFLSRDLREENIRKHIFPRLVKISPIIFTPEISSSPLNNETRMNICCPNGAVKGAVLISNIAQKDMARPIRGWDHDLELSGLHHVLSYGLYPKETLIKMVFSSSVSARRQPLPLRTITTAVDLRASPLVVFACTAASDAVIQEYHVFNHTAGLKISEQFRVNNAKRYTVEFQKNDTLIGFEGNSMSFIRARQLTAFIKTFAGCRDLFQGEVSTLDQEMSALIFRSMWLEKLNCALAMVRAEIPDMGVSMTADSAGALMVGSQQKLECNLRAPFTAATLLPEKHPHTQFT
ncbi:hypothetical protein IW262DRAFT_1297654 [Armillaria fumosa]|nr:hypothetical protein IW262DRAFT_1297654 [Armillaria fumosa]